MNIQHFTLLSLVLLCLGCSKKHELHQVFDENGHLQEEYNRSKKDHAKQGFYKHYYAGGGPLMELAHYVNDTMQGEFIRFYENGDTLSVSMIVDGRYEGYHREYYEGNILHQKYQHLNGAINGDFLGYYKDGTLMEKLLYKDNFPNGPFTEYHPNGYKKTEGTYVEGKELGELLEYDEAGVLVRKAYCAMQEKAKGQVIKVCETTWSKEQAE